MRQSESTAGFSVAFEVTGRPLNVVGLKAALAAQESIALSERRRQVRAAAPEDFRRLVYEFKDHLETLRSHVRAAERTRELNHNDEVADYEAAFVGVITRSLHDSLDPGYQEMSRQLNAMDEDTRAACLEFFSEQIRPLLHEGPLARRSLERPRGYAGDFEMMRFAYRAELVGHSLFGKCVHAYVTSHPNAQAVRNRADYVVGKIKGQIERARSMDRKLRVLSVACGPACEIQQLIETGEDLSGLEIHLMDQDLDALQTAQRDIEVAARTAGVKVDVHFVHKAIRNVIVKGLDEEYDFIYSAGLFDYFSDPVAEKAARRFVDAMAPGGQVVIGNFTTSPQNQLFMEFALDWTLIYRNELDLQRLYRKVSSSISIEAEPNGINLFAVLR